MALGAQAANRPRAVSISANHCIRRRPHREDGARLPIPEKCFFIGSADATVELGAAQGIAAPTANASVGLRSDAYAETRQQRGALLSKQTETHRTRQNAA